MVNTRAKLLELLQETVDEVSYDKERLVGALFLNLQDFLYTEFQISLVEEIGL